MSKSKNVALTLKYLPRLYKRAAVLINQVSVQTKLNQISSAQLSSVQLQRMVQPVRMLLTVIVQSENSACTRVSTLPEQLPVRSW